MKKAIVFIVLLILMTGCNKNNTSNSQNPKDSSVIDKLIYHNIGSESARDEIETLLKNKIGQESLTIFLNDVEEYAGIIKDLKGDYVESEGIPIDYDILSISEEWMKIHPDFIGNNCRITTFALINDDVSLKSVSDTPQNLLFDAESLFFSKKFNQDQQGKFYAYYQGVPTENTKDIQVHLSKMKEHFRSIDLQYHLPEELSVISVIFHDDIDPKHPSLFIGHTGLLVKDKSEYKFIEKLSFDLPYQVTTFKNKQELNDYLMQLYDISWQQDSASPFVMENDELLYEYRPNPKMNETHPPQ